ncbi:hypothetical protein Presley_27 [Acinetobacter phage Presley]|uniref:Uncharacterized protein n=1 Tax=Acinetobacter phage Presley TaxID=1406780 RepID=U5PW08_9CAUD|nr:hypothetical protein Presley_27 [Acinetobacter phage Presley]AGY48094.1 hypothetical protein Presley_27 [Acinetobacter phage Presley]
MKDKPLKIIGLFHINCLNFNQIEDWIHEKNIPDLLKSRVIFVFNEGKDNLNPYSRQCIFSGTLMINPQTREAKFVSYWPQGRYVEDSESESSLSKVISVVVDDYLGLTARANLLGIPL